MRYYLIAFIFSFEMPLMAQSPLNIELIYQNLCNTLHLPKDNIPKLVINTTPSQGAYFLKSENKIVIDKKLIDSFARLKEHQSAAISFVLGHELSHALDKDKTNTYFLAYDKSKNTTFLKEQNADIQGAFISHLAGYNPLPVISDIIEVIYNTYKLNDNLKGYPKLEDRIESTFLIKEQVESLLAVYKMATMCVVIDQFDWANSLFNKVNEYIINPEIKNNEGSTLMLEALNIGDKNHCKYVLPVEFSWDLRLSKPTISDGKKDLEPSLQIQKDILLKKAEYLFKLSLDLNPAFESSYQNLLILKIIQNDFRTAQKLLANINKSTDFSFFIQSILALESKTISKAEALIKKIKNNRLREMASVNLQVGNKSFNTNKSSTCVVKDYKLTSNKSNLFQDKSIQLDSLSLKWSLSQYIIKSPTKRIAFNYLESMSTPSCTPVILNETIQKWENKFFSVKDKSQKVHFFKWE